MQDEVDRLAEPRASYKRTMSPEQVSLIFVKLHYMEKCTVTAHHETNIWLVLRDKNCCVFVCE